MTPYRDWDQDSGIRAYELGSSYMDVAFKDGAIYRYTSLSAGQAKVEQLVLRRTRWDSELLELAEQREIEHEQLGESRLQLQDALDAMAIDNEQRESLLARRDSLRERLDRVRQEARQHKDHAHQLAVRLGSLRAQHDSTRQALERLELQSIAIDGEVHRVAQVDVVPRRLHLVEDQRVVAAVRGTPVRTFRVP
mgnify:CR=1 FL=1